MQTIKLHTVAAGLSVIPAMALMAVTGVEDALLPQDILITGWEWFWTAAAVMAGYVVLAVPVLRRREDRLIVADMCTVALLTAGIWQAGLGLLQVYGWEVSRHSLYALTGSFFNPGPYAGFLAVLAPLALDTWMRHRTAKRWEAGWALALLAAVTLVLVVCVLPAGRSRASWLAAGCACLWVGGRYVMRAIRQSERGRQLYGRFKYVAWTAVTVGVLSAAVGSVFINRASADGRLLIWKVSATAVGDKPWGGHASKEAPAFGGIYGRYQEAYFASGEGTAAEEQVAGVPQYAFNEFIEKAVMYGLPVTGVAVLLLVGVGWCACRRGDNGTAGALIALALFASFSYPLHFPAFAAVLLLLILRTALVCPVPRGVLAGGAALLLCYALAVERPRLSGWKDFYYGWSDCRLLYRTHAYEAAAKAYSRCERESDAAARGWLHADFLFECGHSFYKAEQYDEAIGYLKRAECVSADPMILNVMGECYWKLHKFAEAEQCFKRAAHRLPSRLYPYYLLAKLYADPGWNRKEEACRMAHYVCDKAPKVPSSAVDEMKREMRVMLDKEETKTKQ